jgi:hypothetical protein
MKTLLLCAVLLLPSAAAFADDDAQSSRFFVMVGGFWPDVNTTVRADGNGGRIGTTLDFESDLGLDDRDALFMGGAGMRIGERHYIDLLYFKLAREADHTIDTSIEFGDRVFDAQATLRTSFNTEVIRLSYGYAFISNDKHRLLGQIGAHYTRVSAGLSLRGDRSVSAEADSDVPLPVLGLVYDYSITPRVRLELRAQIFRLEFEGIDGALDNLTASVSYAFTPHISAMVGYNYYSMDVDAQADHWNGSFDFGYQGPWLGVVVGFGSL